MLFQSVLRSKISCLNQKCENEAVVLNYTKINTIALPFRDNLGAALTEYFEDKEFQQKCKKCGKKTTHYREDISLMVPSSILSFSLPRFNLIDRNQKSFRYPIKIDFMSQFSSEYQPSYELFAVIANRGETLYKQETGNHYVTIVKRENGDVIEFDPGADGPKMLSSPE